MNKWDKGFYEDILYFTEADDVRDSTTSIKLITTRKNKHLNILFDKDAGSYSVEEVREIRNALNRFLGEQPDENETGPKNYPFVIGDWALQKMQGEFYFSANFEVDGKIEYVHSIVDPEILPDVSEVANAALSTQVKKRFDMELARLRKTEELLASLDPKYQAKNVG